MTEWELLEKLCSVHNNQPAISELIINSDFDGKPSAFEAAIMIFRITEKNIKKHAKAAEKLISEDPLKINPNMKITPLLRLGLIKGIYESFKQK